VARSVAQVGGVHGGVLVALVVAGYPIHYSAFKIRFIAIRITAKCHYVGFDILIG
jgi:hypothetical protein